MIDSLPQITMSQPGHVYRAGETLRGRVEMPWPLAENCESIELSCLWYTEGKGEEDLGVLLFSQTDGRKEARQGLVWSREFSIALPPSPLSYEGVLMSIVWCIRLRLSQPGKKPLLLEQPFTLVGCRAPYLDVRARQAVRAASEIAANEKEE